LTRADANHLTAHKRGTADELEKWAITGALYMYA